MLTKFHITSELSQKKEHVETFRIPAFGLLALLELAGERNVKI